MALRAVRKGGCVVCGGIHMTDIPAFPYRLLWGERKLVSVANLTRADAREFLALAPAAGIHCDVRPIRSNRPTTPWMTCGRGACRPPLC